MPYRSLNRNTFHMNANASHYPGYESDGLLSGRAASSRAASVRSVSPLGSPESPTPVTPANPFHEIRNGFDLGPLYQDSDISHSSMDHDNNSEGDAEHAEHNINTNSSSHSNEEHSVREKCTFISPYVFQTFQRVHHRDSNSGPFSNEIQTWEPEEEPSNTTPSIMFDLIAEQSATGYMRMKYNFRGEKWAALNNFIAAMDNIESNERRGDPAHYYWVVVYLRMENEYAFTAGLERKVASKGATHTTGWGSPWKS